MFKWKALTFSVMLATSASFAYARGGADGGGGGIGARCGTKLELLDRHEARFEKLTIAVNPQNIEEASLLTSQLLAKHFWSPETVPVTEVIAYLNQGMIGRFLNLESFIDPETGRTITFKKVDSLPLSQDIGSPKLEQGCSLEQIIYFDDATLTMSVVENKWKELSWLDRAMLTAHEMAYLINRRAGLEGLVANVENIHATQTRLFVRKLFSTKPPAARSTGLPEKSIRCQSTSTDLSSFTKFYLYTDEGRTTAVLYGLIGRTSFYQIQGDLGDFDINSLLDLNASVGARFQVQVPEAGALNLTLNKSTSENPTLQATRAAEQSPLTQPVQLTCEAVSN